MQKNQPPLFNFNLTDPEILAAFCQKKSTTIFLSLSALGNYEYNKLHLAVQRIWKEHDPLRGIREHLQTKPDQESKKLLHPDNARKTCCTHHHGKISF